MEDLKADQSSERQQEPNYPLETLLEISKAVNSTLNLDEIFQQITRQAVNVLMASRAVLFLRPAPDDDFVILMSEYDVRDLYESKNRGRYDLSKHTLNRKVMETLKPIQFHVDDLSADLEKSVRESLQELGVKSILMAPLILGDKAIGLFAVDQVGEIRVFTQGEIQLAQILANQAAIALKNAELFESVQKEKRRVEAIIHSSLDGIVVTDMQDVIIHVNPAFSNAFGVDPEEIMGQKLTSLLGRIGYLMMEDRKIEDSAGKLAGSKKLKVVTSHNGRFYQVVSSPFLCQSNQPSGNVLIFRDMTEEEKLQRMKEDLTHMIVHDLKNPLAATMAYIETILSGAIGELLEKQEDFLKRAYNNSNFLLNMICDILDIYKIEEEGVELHIMRESLVVPITHAIHQLEGEQIAKNISVNVDFGDLPNIPFDCKMVTRVCANLLHNAYKFTPTGGDIDVRLYTDDAFHCVQIQDYGLGIPQKYRKKVFDKFAQVGNDGIKSRFSSGIGLAFCKLVIEAHHGKIWVDSGMKKGSAFTFRLPIHQEKEKVTL